MNAIDGGGLDTAQIPLNRRYRVTENTKEAILLPTFVMY